MELDGLVDGQNVGGRDRLVRATLAVILAGGAVRALRAGRRTRGLVAGLFAVGFALNVVTCFCTVNRLLGVDTTRD